MEQDRRRSRLIVFLIGAAFVLFAAWETVFHAGGLRIPHLHAVSLTIEMILALTITMLALHMARPAVSQRDQVLSHLALSLSTELRPRLVSLVAALRALERQHPEGLTEEELDLVRGAATDGGSTLALLEELEGLTEMTDATRGASLRTPLVSVIEAVVGVVSAAAREREVELGVDLTTELPTPEARPDQLMALLVELLAAAVESVPSGGAVKLAVGRAAEGSSLVVSVRGTGPQGQQRPAPCGLRSGGSERCRMLVEALGGTTQEEAAEAGHGFTVRLPARANH